MEHELDLFNYNDLIQEIEDWIRFKQNYKRLRRQLKDLFDLFDLDLGGNGCSISEACKDITPGTWFHELHFPWDEFYTKRVA